jgi:hypothetical protein
MILQLGMRVLIKDLKASFKKDAGTVKKITKELPDFNGERAFGLDGDTGIWLIEDFEKNVDYPELSME